jgi:hypothetical protein
MRPVIPVIARYQDRFLEHEILIDSGSDRCFFSTEFARSIGIKPEKGSRQEVFSVQGTRTGYYSHAVTLEVAGHRYDLEVGFMPSLGGTVVSHGVAGQKGFFDQFIVKFDLLKNEIELTTRK